MTKESRVLKKKQRQQIEKLPFRERTAAGVTCDAPLAVRCWLAGLPLLSAVADSSGGALLNRRLRPAGGIHRRGPVPHSLGSDAFSVPWRSMPAGDFVQMRAVSRVKVAFKVQGRWSCGGGDTRGEFPGQSSRRLGVVVCALAEVPQNLEDPS